MGFSDVFEKAELVLKGSEAFLLKSAPKRSTSVRQQQMPNILPVFPLEQTYFDDWSSSDFLFWLGKRYQYRDLIQYTGIGIHRLPVPVQVHC